jgi:hypothetical protein
MIEQAAFFIITGVLIICAWLLGKNLLIDDEDDKYEKFECLGRININN